MTERLQLARKYHAAGLSQIAIGAGSKTPAVAWKDYQKRLPTDAELCDWIERYSGLGIVCGSISGNLEVLDIEFNAPIKHFAELVDARAPGLLAKLPRVKTPRGGRHLYYRCEVIEGNQKLAADKKGETLIETRGQGGQVLSPLSLPETHPNGKAYQLLAGDLTQIPTITPEEREILFNAARSLNEYVQPEKARGYREPSEGEGLKPGADYNGRSGAANRTRELLRGHGWSRFGKNGSGEQWSRPGIKDHGSATLFEDGTLYVFSSNAVPFTSNEAYSPFAVYAELKHSGDFSAAAKALAQLGFGSSNGHKPAASPQSKAQKGFSLTTVDDLIAEPAENVAYAWDRTLPCGGLSVQAAKPKVGKSTLARNLAVAVSKGQPFFGRATKQGKVIYLCLEEKRTEVAEHFRRMGATGSDILIFTGKTPDDIWSALDAAIEEHSPVLVIIDPLSRFIRIADFNSYAEVTRALEPLIDLARLSNCGTHIMALHHNGKSGDMREAGDAVMGSSAIFGAVDCLLTMRKRDRARTIESTQRYGEDLPETIVHLNPVTGIVEAAGDMAEFELSERKKAVLDSMRDEPLTEAAIKELVSGSNSGLTSKAVRSLFDEGKLFRTGAGKKGDPFVYRKTENKGVTLEFSDPVRRAQWETWQPKERTA